MLIYSDLPYYSVIFPPLIAAIFSSHFYSVFYNLNKFTINKYGSTFLRSKTAAFFWFLSPRNQRQCSRETVNEHAVYATMTRGKYAKDVFGPKTHGNL